MSNVQNYKIGVVIDADASKLQVEAKKADKAIEGIGKQSFGTLKKELGETASAFGLIPDSASNLTGSLTQATGSVENIITAMGPAGAVAGGVAIGLTAVTAAGIAVTKTLFDLAKQASDYGSEFKDAQEITGLSVETLGALRFAAEQGGKTFGDVNSTVGKFVKTLASAKEGNKEAEATMKDLGVTSYDLETALGQAYKTISETTEGTDQMRAAQKAFGKSGAELLPMIKAMDGDLEKFKETARKLGVTLTEEDVKAADDFGDTLGLLQTQAKVSAAKFALEYAPQITGAMSDISKYFSQNSDEIRYWGKEVGNVITGTIETLKVLEIVASGVLDGMGLAFLSQAEKMRLVVNSMINFISPLVGLLNVVGQFTNSGKLHTATPSVDQYVKIPTKADAPSSIKSGGSKSGGAKGSATGVDSFATNRTKAQYAAAMAKLSPALKGQIVAMAEQYGIPQALAFAQLFSESSFNTKAQSPNNKGVGPAFGLTQMVAPTAARVLKRKVTGEMLKNDSQLALTGWGKYMTELFNRYHDWDLAVLAYHQGEGTVDKLVKLLDQGKSGSDFFAKRPKGKAYLQKVGALSGLSGDKKFELSTEVSAGTALITQYQEKIDTLGETTERQRLERNKDFPKLSEQEKEKLQFLADQIDEAAAATKATEGYNSIVDSLNDSYNNLFGEEKSSTQALNEKIDALKKAGVILDEVGIAQMKYKALLVDVEKDERKINAALEDQNRLRRESAVDVGPVDPRTYNGRSRVVAEDKAPELKSSAKHNLATGLFGDLKDQMYARDSSGALLLDENGLARFKTKAEIMKSTMTDLGEIGAGVMNQMAQATGAALEGWILYGDGVGESLKKATAQILAQVAAESAVKAIYQLAEGFAALIWNPPAAAIHFKSAALYGAVAIASGVAARGLSGGSKNGSAGSSNGTAQQQQQQDNRKFDFVRNSDNVGSNQNQNQTNNQLQLTVNELRESVQQLTAANQSLQSRINTQPAGVLVAKGIKESPGLVSDTMTSEMRKNSTSASNFGRIIGVS